MSIPYTQSVILNKLQSKVITDQLPACHEHSPQIISHICTNYDCVNYLNCFLCFQCLETHPITHQEQLVPWETSIFNTFVKQKIEQLIPVQEEKINQAYKHNQEFFGELDEAYHQIELYFKNMIESSKNRMILKGTNVYFGNHQETTRWITIKQKMTGIVDHILDFYGKINDFKASDNLYWRAQQLSKLRDNLKNLDEVHCELIKAKEIINFSTSIDPDAPIHSKEEPRLFLSTFFKNKKLIEDAFNEIESELVIPVKRRVSPKKQFGSSTKELMPFDNDGMEHDNPIDLFKSILLMPKPKATNFLMLKEMILKDYDQFVICDWTEFNDHIAEETAGILKTNSNVIKDLTILLSSFKKNMISLEGERKLYEGLSQLPNLTQFNLSLLKDSNLINQHNITQVSSYREKFISDMLRNLQQLNHLTLDFHYNVIQESGLQMLCESIKLMPMLNSLNLNFDVLAICLTLLYENLFQFRVTKSAFTEFSAGCLVDMLQTNKALSVIKLSLKNQILHQNILQSYNSNNLTTKWIQIFCNCFYQMPKLTSLSLDLSNNQIDDNGIITFSEALRSLKALKQLLLRLSYNELTDAAISSFANALKETKFIRILMIELKGTKITDKSFENIGDFLVDLKYLENLNLSLIGTDNKPYLDQAVKELSKGLSKLRLINTLRLNLSCNFITDLGAQFLSKAFCHLLNMRDLYLNFGWRKNKITDTGLKYIADAIMLMLNLTNLTLLISGTQHAITSLGFQDLIEAIKLLDNLTLLNLEFQFNEIDQKEFIDFGDVLDQAKMLKSFTFDIRNSKNKSMESKDAKDAIKKRMNMLNIQFLSVKIE